MKNGQRRAEGEMPNREVIACSFLRDETEIKVPLWRRMVVGSFHGDDGHIVRYVTKIAMENTDNKTR